MKILLLFYSTLLLASCGALRINKVTEDSSKFERYHKGFQKCLDIGEGKKRVNFNSGKATVTIEDDLLGITWEGTTCLGQEVVCACALTPNNYLAGQTEADGVFRNFPEVQEEKIAYKYFNQVLLENECPVLGEKELNEKIKEKKESAFNMWASLFKAKAP